MSTSMRRAAIGALVLFGLLAVHGAAQAQFAFGQTRFGFNPSNPFVAQQQFIANLQSNALAIRMGAQVPAALPYLSPFAGPSAITPFAPGVMPGFAPAIGNPYGGWGGGWGGGINPYGGAFGPGVASSNPYSPVGGGGFDAAASNPYAAGMGMGFANPFANPAVGPGVTLMGSADLVRAYGSMINAQEQARIMREKYYQEKLETKKKKFDLEMYIKANTPTWTEEQEKIAKTQLKRIQGNSNPAEIIDGRALNFLLDDIAKHPGKAPISEIPLDESILQHLNVRPAGTNKFSLGLLRTGTKLTWPTALIEMLPAETRKEMEARALALAQSAIFGKEPDVNAMRDLRGQIDKAQEQLLKKANYFDTPDYSAAQRFLADLQTSVRAISAGNDAAAQVQYQQQLTRGSIQNLSDLVRVMVARGWRFAPALPADEGPYRALYSALVSFDVALNQMVAQTEP
jgi:hypothetical protein